MTLYELKLETHDEKHKIFQKFMKVKAHVYLKYCFQGEDLLVIPPTPNLVRHPLSAVRSAYLNFSATIHIWQQSSLPLARGGSMP